ncbi:MAG: hypothetical protein ACKPEA_05890, partial [Planctomycetota bacterium]
MSFASRSHAVLPLAALLLACTASHATITLVHGQRINMAELFAPGSDRRVAIDDKIFTFESYTSSQFDKSEFTVVGYVSETVNQWGLHEVGFDITGSFQDGNPRDGLMHELNLQYSVEVSPEAYSRHVRLCDTHLLFDGMATGVGSYARVDETIWDLDANRFLGNMSAYDKFGPPHMTKLSDMRDFCDLYGVDGYRAFEVNKDLK